MLRQDELDFLKAIFFSFQVSPAAPGKCEEEEKASGACREMSHTIRKRDQCFPTARGQAKSQRAS